MRAYVKRQFEDPLDGKFPTKQSKARGRKRRAKHKRIARKFKKGVRQDAMLSEKLAQAVDQ